MDNANHSLASTSVTSESRIENCVTIEPPKGLIRIDFRELWNYRDLFRFLVWRDILIRYKQTLLGGAWAVLQPLTAMVIFTVFFGRLAKMPSDGLPYPVFSYTALLLWSFFAQSVTQSANSLVANEKLVTKIFFPRLIVPAAPVLAGLLDLSIACCLLLVLLPYYGIGLSVNIWAVPIMVVVAAMAALGAGTWIAALNVKYRDFRYVLPFLIQTWMFLSPVVYPASMVPEKWRIFYGLNPMAGAIEGFRWALLETNVNPWPILAVSVVSAVTILLFGVIYFQRTEEFFADLI